MQHSFTLAASLLTLLPTVLAAGTAHVVNNCGTDIWFASVAQNVGAPMQKMGPGGGYSETYTKANVGISIKLAATEGGAVTQFEFTWDSPNINYDISNIDGNPFAEQGTSLVPSMIGASGYPTCVAVNCPAGQATCDAAYNMPDDIRTKVCPEDSDLTFTLCPGGAAAPAPPAASSSTKASASVPASTPASVPVSTPSSAPSSSAPAFSKSPAASAAPTSFRTSTTPAAIPSAAASTQIQAPAAPSSVVQSPQDTAPATTAAAQNTAAAQTWTWTRGGGGWGGHYHTRRAHIHRFDS